MEMLIKYFCSNSNRDRSPFFISDLLLYFHLTCDLLSPRARESSQSDFSDCPFEGGDSSQEKQPKTKKVRVSDMNVTRYQVLSC